MAENSKIEWCHHTANLWWGCTEVHEGCDNCYARVLDNRWNGNHWGNDRPRRMIKSVFNDLKKYQENASKVNEIHRVFVGSMMDIFEKPMPLENPTKIWKTTDDMRKWFFAKINANCYPNLLFLFLTKRPSNINKYIPESWKINPPANVMFGTSPVNQKTARILIPQLLKVKGRHFLSIEPQLGEISFRWIYTPDEWRTNGGCGEYEIFIPHGNGEKIDWVIVGGESGAKKRPFNPDWARKLRDECNASGTPFFMKQIDKVQTIPEDLMIREFPKIKVPA